MADKCMKCGDLMRHDDDGPTLCRFCNQCSAEGKNLLAMDGPFVFPMKILPWTSLSTSLGLELSAGPQMRAVGYIPVYDNIIALQLDHGNQVQCQVMRRASESSEMDSAEPVGECEACRKPLFVGDDYQVCSGDDGVLLCREHAY